MIVKLELDINMVNKILALLGEIQWKHAHPIISTIQEQMAPQLKPPPAE
jgi:hypothetical protein